MPDQRECSIVAQSIMKSVIESGTDPKDVDRITRHHLVKLHGIVADMVAGRDLLAAYRPKPDAKT